MDDAVAGHDISGSHLRNSAASLRRRQSHHAAADAHNEAIAARRGKHTAVIQVSSGDLGGNNVEKQHARQLRRVSKQCVEAGSVDLGKGTVGGRKDRKGTSARECIECRRRCLHSRK